MTTTTLTPVWDMPKPGMLSNGMPLPLEPEGAIGVTVVRRDNLTARVSAAGRKGGFTLVLDQPPVAGDPRLTAIDALFVAALGEYAQIISPQNAVSSTLRLVSRERVVQEVERLRSSLLLTAEQTAAIAGIGPRRYYELVGEKPFPEARLTEISNRVAVINALAARDWQTAMTLVRNRADETIQMLDDARLRDLQDLFSRTQQERISVLEAAAGFDLAGLASQYTQALTGILEAPAFDVAAKMIQWIGRADEQVKDRSKALVEVLKVFKALEDDDQVGEKWDWIYSLTADKRTAFRSRAEAFIRGDAFTRDRWDAFVAMETERALDAATTVRLEPLATSIETYADEEVARPAWHPDMTQISAGFRPYERRR